MPADTTPDDLPAAKAGRRLRISPVDGAYMAVVVLLCIAIIRTFVGEYALDDSFIGYDNAQNLAAGHGFAFNPGDDVLTTSAPLAVLLYAGVALINHADILAIAQTFAALACLVIGLAGYALVRRFAAPEGALAASIVLLGSPYTLLLWSHESYLCLAMVLVGLLYFEEGWIVAAAVVLGLAALMRPEAVLVVPFVALRLLRQGRRMEAARFSGIGVAPLILWSAFAFIHFGSAASQSIAAKHAELAYNPVAPYLFGLFALPSQVLALGFFQVIPHLLIDSIVAVWIAAAVAGLIRPIHLAVVAWAGLLTALYVYVGVPFFLWFAMQIGVLLALTASIAWPAEPLKPDAPLHDVRSAARAVARIGGACVAGVCALFLFIATGQPYRLLTYARTLVMPLVDVSVYRQLGVWLADHTAPSDSVAYPEIGQIRYYSGRSIVDFEGLVNAGVPQHVAVGDTIWAFKKYRPTIYVDQPAWHDFVLPTEFDWFDRAYRHTDRVPILMYPTLYNFDIYRLTDPSAVPAADDLDDRPVVQDPDVRATAVHFDFRPSGARLDGVDIRVIPRSGCPRGAIRVTRSDGGLVASKSFALPPMQTPIRVSLQFAPIDGSQGQTFAADITGCRGLALAPRTELRRVAPLETGLPTAPPGPPAAALSVYLR